MKIHKVKSWNFLFQPIWDGNKLHDLRKDDRDFEIGDHIVLQEYDPATGKYSGREVEAEITFITSVKTPCALSSNALARDHAILSISVLAKSEDSKDHG